jgi:hypothetical protein
MLELQRPFLLGFMQQFVSEICTPLLHTTTRQWQKNDVPDDLHIVENIDQKAINDAIDMGLDGVWLADRNAFLKLPTIARDPTVQSLRQRRRRRARRGGAGSAQKV